MSPSASQILTWPLEHQLQLTFGSCLTTLLICWYVLSYMFCKWDFRKKEGKRITMTMIMSTGRIKSTRNKKQLMKCLILVKIKFLLQKNHWLKNKKLIAIKNMIMENMATGKMNARVTQVKTTRVCWWCSKWFLSYSTSLLLSWDKQRF